MFTSPLLISFPSCEQAAGTGVAGKIHIMWLSEYEATSINPVMRFVIFHRFPFLSPYGEA
jgi:hypothetical protein